MQRHTHRDTQINSRQRLANDLGEGSRPGARNSGESRDEIFSGRQTETEQLKAGHHFGFKIPSPGFTLAPEPPQWQPPAGHTAQKNKANCRCDRCHRRRVAHTGDQARDHSGERPEKSSSGPLRRGLASPRPAQNRVHRVVSDVATRQGHRQFFESSAKRSSLGNGGTSRDRNVVGIRRHVREIRGNAPPAGGLEGTREGCDHEKHANATRHANDDGKRNAQHHANHLFSGLSLPIRIMT